MSDPVFEAFRRKLADVVTVAINSGKRVSASDGSCNCPLGCHPNAIVSRPVGWIVARDFGASASDLSTFGTAFDGSRIASGPYAELGRLYRARFP